MSRLWRGLAVVGISLQLGGCALGLLGSGPPPTTYDLAASVGGRQLGGTAARLAVRVPTAIQIFDSERIAIRPEAGLVAYYGGAQWTDRLPPLIEARLVEAFERSGVRTVTRISDGLTVDYQLLSEVRDFSVHNTQAGQFARVSLYVKLAGDREGRTIAGRLFEAEAPVHGDDTAAGVAALSVALGEVLVGVVRWTLASI